MKTEQEIVAWLQQHLSAILNGVPGQVDINVRFKDYGLESRSALLLTQKLSEWLGQSLEQTLVWDYPTIAELAAYIVNPQGVKREKRTNAANTNYHEPVAVVGIACRFPGANDKNAYWDMLKNGLSGIREVPSDRWNIDEYLDENPLIKGKMNTKWGGFIEQVDKFDPEFFGISPREANQMDPQQRLMLELTWEAVEDAGTNPTDLKGSDTGVFYSAIWNDYLILNSREGVENIEQHTATGMHHSVIPNRVSYFLGLEGPSLAVDTACSSSLVSVHLAMQSLRSNECSIAFAGGVNLIIAPDTTIGMTKFGAMAPDGQSKAFDARANGYVRGEGAGVLVLKPLSKALADGDRIYAQLLGSAVNNDGFSNGLTAPNPRAQEKMLEDAYHNAGVDINHVHYVEAHGTGTILGDPIEAKAIGNILCSDRSSENCLVLGSVKTNIGHLEGAAGIAGLIKVILSVQHKQIPPNLNFEAPNPNIDFDQFHLKVPQRLMTWPEDGNAALAGVSSFGFGGTNCHVVVAEAVPPRFYALPFSADSSCQLKQQISVLLDEIANDGGVELSKIVQEIDHDLNAATRAVFVANSVAGLAKQLREYLDTADGEKQQAPAAMGNLPVVFICSGQGSQWMGMAKSLLLHEPVFAHKIKEIDKLFVPLAGWSLHEYLLNSQNERNTAEMKQFVIQPAIFAVQVSLAALLSEWGIEADGVMGHSMGEVSAAYIAGILTLNDAVKTIYTRSSLLTQLEGRGKMAVVEMTADELERAIEPYGASVTVAGYNSYRNNIIAGDPSAVQGFVAEVQKNRYVKLVNVEVASHCYQMDEITDDLINTLQDISPLPGTIPLMSTVAASYLDHQQFTAGYWADNVRQPVKFYQSVVALTKRGAYQWVELSAHPILTRAVEEILAETDSKQFVTGTLERKEDDHRSLLENIAKLYLNGKNVNWNKVNQTDADDNNAAWSILPLSAHSPAALAQLTKSVRQNILKDRIKLNNLVSSSIKVRTQHRFRTAVAFESKKDLLAKLSNLAVTATTRTKSSKVAFVFSGQGNQWFGMARELYNSNRYFRENIQNCDNIYRRIAPAGKSIADALTNSASFDKDSTECMQPVIFAMQFALARLWQQWGLEPAAVVGHSMGEVAAACIAGGITLENAITIICNRGRLMQKSCGLGAMVLINDTIENIHYALVGSGLKNSVFISANNSPTSYMVSGGTEPLAEFCRYLDIQNISYRAFSDRYAFHSPLMEPFAAELEGHTYNHTEPLTCSVPFYSTVTGERYTDSFTPGYWANNMKMAVRFESAIKALIACGVTTFVEIGPHNVLQAAVLENARETDITFIPSLKRDKHSYGSMYEGLAVLYGKGFPVNWASAVRVSGHQADLPEYPFQRKRYWLNNGQQQETQAIGNSLQSAINGRSILHNVQLAPQNDLSQQLPVKGQFWLLFSQNYYEVTRLISWFKQNDIRYLHIITTAAETEVENYAAALQQNRSKVNGALFFYQSANANDFLTDAQLPANDIHNITGLLKAIKQEDIKVPRFYFVFRNDDNQPTPDKQPHEAALWKLTRTLASEFPLTNFKNIRIGNTDGDIENLFAEIASPDAEDTVVYQEGKRLSERLTPHLIDSETIATIKCDPNKVYLVTGGMGGLGLQLANFLVKRGARHLLLVSKSGYLSNFDDYNKLIRTGAHVKVSKADVASLPEMELLLAGMERPLGGIIHAAGRVVSKAFVEQRPEETNEVLLPKIAGTLNLHQLTKHLPLQFFICLSSVSTAIGSARLGSYVAANAFLDGFSHYRRRNGLPCTTINLGPVAEVGMVVNKTDVFDTNVLNKIGLRLINTGQVFAALEYMLFHNISHLIVADIDYEKLKEVIGSATSLLNSFTPDQPAISNALANGEDGTETDHIAYLTVQLQRSLEMVMDIADHDVSKNMFDSGLDSLMVIGLIRQIQIRLSVKIDPVLIYTNSSIDKLADALHLAINAGDAVLAEQNKC
ncbi:SDR family NAD(P)-dependent oxidoreductase [Mucilaginibacter sp. 21P]|uniref:type I polyketide synthase n=1 Tax=Mucilaginibacter sp. 21P TaxID=2778902 RepID=UPI001C55DA69|nr:type I polyketide synthase [Mucilaginibacter sp. 21P]QXV63897.1 SDR family NAD(P)-dependent oxidoreductase [Mucilaginibacter sp. 21P]